MNFQLGHISDLHVFALDNPNPTRFLNKRVVGGVNLTFNRSKTHDPRLVTRALRRLDARGVDHIAVTGDVSNIALEEEFQAVARMLDDVQDARERVSVVPGNHDYYIPQVARMRTFERILGRFQQSDLPQYQLGTGYPFCKLRGDVAIIGLNTGTPTLPLWATGKVDDRELRALGHMLDDEAVRDRFTIVMLHHPLLPFEHTKHDYSHRLVNAADVLDVLRRREVDLVIHGHNHYYHLIELPHLRGNGTLRICEAGSVSVRAHDEEHRRGKYNIYHIEEGRLASVETHIFQDDTVGFVPWVETKLVEGR